MRNYEGIDLDEYEAVQLPPAHMAAAQRFEEAAALCRQGAIVSGVALVLVLVVL